MFDFKTFWHYHRRKWWLEQRPKPFDRLSDFFGHMLRSWPRRHSGGGLFGNILYLAKIFVSLFLCWAVTDWLFPVNPLVSIPLAFLLWQLTRVFVRKVRNR